MDSMTVYREMDIGTAKPSTADQVRIPHHVLDLIDPHEDYSIANYLQDATTACTSILKRGKVPILVGGTGLYLRALLRGMSTGPAGDMALREELTQLAQDHPEQLWAELEQVDPAAATKLHLRDTKRIIRAIEVFRLTGQRISDQQAHGPLPLGERPLHVYWLSPPRDWLYVRINQRVIEMFEQGLLQEVQLLLRRPQGLGPTAYQGLGYKEVIEYLEQDPELKDKTAYHAMIDQIQTRTRQFAKRQHTWFRNLEECHAIEMTGTETADELAEMILNFPLPYS